MQRIGFTYLRRLIRSRDMPVPDCSTSVFFGILTRPSRTQDSPQALQSEHSFRQSHSLFGSSTAGIAPGSAAFGEPEVTVSGNAHRPIGPGLLITLISTWSRTRVHWYEDVLPLPV